MPWTAADAEGHTKKANTAAKQKEWAKVANNARAQCVKAGGEPEECDGRAIRIANAAMEESGMEYKAYTTSTNSVLISVNAIDVGGEAVPVAELVTAYEERRGQEQESAERNDADLQEAVWTTAFVNNLPDSNFAVIMPGGEKDEEGKTKPRSLRKLPYKDAGGKVDVPHLRNALARLPQMKGVSAELKAKALKTLQAAAKKHLKTHQEETEKVDIAKVRDLLQEALTMLDAPMEMTEVELAESAMGHVIELAKEGVSIKPRDPLLMKVALIKPGFGNEKDKHYYPIEVLERDAHVFEGVKMYATDHRPEEKSVRTEVAVITACPVAFTDDGAPIAHAAVHDPDFAEQARNRDKLDTLDTLECSILALGRTRKGDVDGKEANIVEAITKGQSVDWVTKAGAGGHAVALAESNTGGVKMDKEQIEKLLSESELPQEAQERLAGAEYEDESALRQAVLAEVEYVKTLTGSGQPFGQGPSQGQREEKPLSERLDEVDRRHGLRVQETQEV